jgi:hypothetical protein
MQASESGWSRKFDEPIPLPKGRQLITLKEAQTYITKLPKAEHTAPEWQAAMAALILVATHGGPTMLARITGRLSGAVAPISTRRGGFALFRGRHDRHEWSIGLR